MSSNGVTDIDNKVMKSETLRLQHEQSTMKEKIRDNGEKIKQNKVLPYLVGNVVEVLATLYQYNADRDSFIRSWMSTQKVKKTEQIKTSILCAKENALSLRPPPDRPCSCP